MTVRLAAAGLLCTLLSGAPVTLLDGEGRKQSFNLEGQPTVVLFISAVCPVSNEYVDRMNRLYADFNAKGVRFLVVNSNVNESGQEVREHAAAAGFPFPVYRDIRNSLADKLKATITPEAYLIDQAGTVRYQGPIDDARNPARVKEDYLREALEAILAGHSIHRSSAKATGCTIKREKKTS